MSVKNFVQCGLVTPVAANTTELVLMAPTASYQYPPLDGGTLVIADSVARPSFYEIISYTHRIENVLYGVVRAKEGTTARTWSGVTWIYQALTAQDYVDALALKAPLASPALTGVPTAPTAPLGTNTQQIATMAAVQAAIANLVASSPAALDTLNELAAALGNDPNFATTMNNALAGKEPSIAAGTSAQMWLGNKTWASVLTQVQNTLLTGLGAGSNATILTTDTLIGALAKIQNQLNNKANFTDPRLSDAREWTATEVSQAEAEAGTTTIPRKWSALRVWQAVLASSLTGLNLTVGTAVAASDTVLVAIGKLQKQITDAASNLAGSVRATVLTGYVSGSNAILSSTDTVLAAFGKVQAQITALATSKLDTTANAVSATKLATARTITLGGDLTGSVAFDGSANALLNAALPARLGKTAQVITDWDLAIENGYYQGSNALNAPSPEWNIGHVISYGGAGWVTQEVHSFTTDSPQDSKAFRRERNNGTWGPWYRLRTTEAEQAALYNNASNLSSGIVPDARLSGTYTGVSITGNAGSANRAGTLNWTNYGGGQGVGNGSHVIFDASNGVSPSGHTINNTNSEISWNSSYPTLMGWNGTNTYGVRVDRARYAESLSSNITINGVAANAGYNITVADSTKLPLTGGTLTGNLYGTRGIFTGTGNDYHLGGLEVVGNGSSNTVFPTIGFHQPGIYASSIQLRAGSDFRFYAQGGSDYASVTADNFNGTTCTLAGRASVGDVLSQGWLRTIGAIGWYNETYAGGIHMQDATYVRTYNGKSFLCNNVMRVEGYTPQVQLWDADHGILRYLYADGGSIGFLNSTGDWSLINDIYGNTTSTGNVTAYSDIRLKTDIEVIPEALDKVTQLRGVTYKRIDSGERQTGVIAQEVQAVLPEAVMTMTDEQQTLSVAYGNLVGLLVEAIKELNHKVDNQAREIAELRAL